MKRITRYPRSFSIIILISLLVFLIIRCTGKEEGSTVIKNTAGKAFSGSQTCASCHKGIYNKHIHTAHFLTSKPALAQYILGSFDEGRNSYAFNGSVIVSMEKRADGFYQVEYFRGAERKAKKMEIVVGSGTMGQSYLYWQDGKLFQMPITYFTAAHTWSNSPGFPDKVVFNRFITSRCLECHTSYVKTVSAEGQQPEEFDSSQIIYGIDCEKCHGPGADHVAFQSSHPKESKAQFIINPAQFTRQQKLDLCASCHGGRLQKTKPSFSFMPGDTLSNYFVIDTTAPDPTHIDVHANQYGLLRASKCFRFSATLTCNSCHNTHENERGQKAVFSQRCQSCHPDIHRNDALHQQMGNTIFSNCIDCHMPVQSSRAIAVQLQGDMAPVAAQIRSHFISIYPDETKKVLKRK
ncbi:MAG: multiheme c-type cytochrome [Flavisolibacter sp.]